MTNVVAFPSPAARTRGGAPFGLISAVALHRRPMEDVYWLKESGEVLGVLTATGTPMEGAALDPYAPFYDGIAEQLRFFPQYYRFLLSICLDLEDLGLPGNKAEALCHWAFKEDLQAAELSDLQRAEARRLLARRGVSQAPFDGALGARLRSFAERTRTFAMPNKKAAYELTHIVFYLSEYGRIDPQLSSQVITSLEFAGLLAFLDQNMDLLAEVCTALSFAKAPVSDIWRTAVLNAHAGIRIGVDANVSLDDAFHAFLVTGWAAAAMGNADFSTVLPEGPARFLPPEQEIGALRPLSEGLLEIGGGCSRDWSRMRSKLSRYLDADSLAVLEDAERSTENFDIFFEGFSRAVAH